MKVSRIEAAKELNAIYNSYECKKNKLSTTYRKIFFDENYQRWRLIGFAHDYSF